MKSQGILFSGFVKFIKTFSFGKWSCSRSSYAFKCRVFRSVAFVVNAFFQIRKTNRKKLGNQCFPSAIFIKTETRLMQGQWKLFWGQGKVREKSGNFLGSNEWQPWKGRGWGGGYSPPPLFFFLRCCFFLNLSPLPSHFRDLYQNPAPPYPPPPPILLNVLRGPVIRANWGIYIGRGEAIPVVETW